MSQDQRAAKLQTGDLDVNLNFISRKDTRKRVAADFELKVLAAVLNVEIYELVDQADS